MKSNIPKTIVEEVCTRSHSMAKAAAELNIHFNTLKRLAILYKCYHPNQGLKGGNKNAPPKITLDKILSGEHPSFQTYKLKNRLLKEGLIIDRCVICGIDSWNDKKINLELDHIDGNRLNHQLTNLRMLCPNCHSQTDTYRSKNRKHKT
jgi:5-methylcytosine-specific restriction endonuclease McrA